MYLASYLALLSLVGAAPALAQRRCNGFEEFCDRSLGNITFIGVHDSFADADAEGLTVGVGASSNQYLNVSRQLADGARMLQGQGHGASGNSSEVRLCHSSCALLDGGTLTDYLVRVRDFLDANPDEFLIFVWVNDGPAVESWASSYRASGMDRLSYVPPSTPVRNTDWPTIGELLDGGSRVLSFMDDGADEESVPYILDEFSNVFESQADPLNNSFPCDLVRPEGESPDGLMYMVNHNLNNRLSESIVLPALSAVNTTNAACGENTIQQHVENCVALYDRNPNIILLDFYNYPANQPFQAANFYNGVGPDPCDANDNYIGNQTGFATSSSASSTSTPTGASAGGDSSASPTESAPGAASSSGLAIGLKFDSPSLLLIALGLAVQLF